jgi:hypothetical protein
MDTLYVLLKGILKRVFHIVNVYRSNNYGILDSLSGKKGISDHNEQQDQYN